MDFLAQIIIPYILLYKYWALFIVTFLASLAIPIPAGTLLIASAAFASQGYFQISTLLFIVILANVLGDNVSYWIARLYGKKILSKIPFIEKILISKNFVVVEKNINKYPGFVIILSRFEVISTLTINLICGLGKTSYKKYMIFELIGTFLSVIFYFILGYSFGDSWQIVNKLIGNFSLLFFLIIILAISLFWKKIVSKLNKNL
jgi:membrane-associated protein